MADPIPPAGEAGRRRIPSREQPSQEPPCRALPVPGEGSPGMRLPLVVPREAPAGSGGRVSAAGGALSRRRLLRLALLGGGAAALSACGWDGGPLEPALHGVSRWNDRLGEALISSSRLAPRYPLDRRTPEEAFPAYSRTRPMAELRLPEAADWALEVGGLVRTPIRLTRPMLEAMPRLTYTVKHHCVEGWTAIGTWTGVPVASVAALVEPLPEARFLRFDSFDSGYYNGWDLKSAFHPQTILAYAFNDQPLDLRRGAPLRLYSPIKLGYKSTKYLSALSFTAQRPGGYWEDKGYPWLGGI